MILNAATQSIQLILASAKTTNDCPYTASYIDGSISTYTPLPAFGNTNGTSAVSVITGPASNQVRVQEMTVYNADTAAVTVTVRLNDNGTTYILHKVTLQVGDTLGYCVGVGFYALDSTGARKQAATRTTNDRLRPLHFTINGSGSVITTGSKDGVIIAPFAGVIQSWTLVEATDTPISGAIVIDIWKDTYANYPPTVADTITGSAKPTITASATKATSSTLTGWTTHFDAGDIFKFKVDSVTSLKRVEIYLAVLTD